MSIFTPKISDGLFFSHRPGFSDFALFTVIKCHIRPFLHKKNHYFRKEFLYKTIFFCSVHPFAHIRQHYFSKYWGGPMHGPSPHLKFWGDRPPQSKYAYCMSDLHDNYDSGFLRLICIAMVGLGAPLSRFLEGASYKFLNE